MRIFPKSRLITHGGQTLSCIDWSRKLGAPSNIVAKRLYCGWTEQEAVTVPYRGKRPPGPSRDGKIQRTPAVPEKE